MRTFISYEQVKEIIQRYLDQYELSDVELEQPLHQLEIDSFGRVQLLVALEDELGVSIPNAIIWSRTINVRELIDAVIGCPRGDGE